MLNPANAFAHPLDVVDDTDMTLAEKRAFLNGWRAPVPTTYRRCATTTSWIALKELARRSGDLADARRAIGASSRHRMPGEFGRKDDPRAFAARIGLTSARRCLALADGRATARISAQNTLYFERGE